MALPMKMLLEPVSTGAVEDQHASRAPLLDYIYRVSRGKEGDLPCLAVKGAFHNPEGTEAALSSTRKSCRPGEKLQMQSVKKIRLEMYNRQGIVKTKVKGLKQRAGGNNLCRNTRIV